MQEEMEAQWSWVISPWTPGSTGFSVDLLMLKLSLFLHAMLELISDGATFIYVFPVPVLPLKFKPHAPCSDYCNGLLISFQHIRSIVPAH